MPAKLQIPTRVQGQDDAQYAQAVRESIKSQRPYLSDDEIQSLSSFEVTNSPKSASPIKAVALKAVVPQISKEKAAQIKSPFTNNLVGQENFDKQKAFNYANELSPTMADPKQSAATARMLEKFIPTQPKEAPMELVGKDFAPETPRQASALNKIVPNLKQVTENAPIQVQPSSGKRDESIKEYILGKQTPIRKDEFDVEAEMQIPQGSANEKLVFAETLRQNNEKLKQNEAIKISSEISDNDFNKAIQRDFIEKQDRGFVLEQKYGGFKDEINKSIRDYMETPQFKPDVVRISKEQGVSLNQAAQIALDQKSVEYANAPSALEAKMQKFSDWAATNDIPLDYTAAKTATAGLKGLTDVGAFGAAAFEAAVNSAQNLVKGDSPDYLNEFARRNAAMQRTSRVAVPQAQSQKASPFTQGVSDVTSMVAAIGVPMAVAPQVNMFTKAKNILSFGRGGEKALQQGLSAEAQLASKATTNANKLALDIGKVLQSKPANVTAKILDNTAQNYMIMGSPTMDAQRQKYLALGFSEEEANRRASGMTFLTNLALALPNTLRPNEMSIMDKVFNLGNFKEGAKAAVKQGVHFGVGMTALRAAEEALDNQALRAKGIEVEEIPFEQQLQDKFTHATKDFAVGALMSVMGRMKYRQSDMQLAGIAEAFNNPEALNESIKNSVKSGKVSKEDAVAFQTFLNTLKPEYDKAVTEVRRDGTPKFAPAIAAKVAIERTKQKQAEEALQSLENSVEKWKTYETDKDGKPIEKILYRHSDGKMYDYEEAKTLRQRSALVGAVMDARKTVAQLESGQYVKGKLVSANQMKAITEMNSLNGEAKKGQLEAIEANAPFENVEFEVVDFAKQPEIAKRVEEIKASGEIPPEMPSANDPILNEKGEVIEGRTQVAHAIVRGGGKITFMKPLSTEKAKESTNIALGDKLGETQPITEGLEETDIIAINEAKDIFDKHLEANEGDFDGALKAAARDLTERQYTADETKYMLKRLNGENSVSEAIVDAVYRDKNKVQEPVSQETENSVENDWMFKNGDRKINVSDIEDTRAGGDMSLKEAVDRVSKGQESVTEGLPIMSRSKNGKWVIADGYHRVAKSILEGKKEINAAVENSIAIKNALSEGKYQKAIKDGLMTAKQAKEIIESADFAGEKLEVPKDIIGQSKNETDGRIELESIVGRSESENQQSEGTTSGTEQSDVRAVEANKEGQEAKDQIAIAKEKGLKDMSIAERMRQRASAIQEKNTTFEKTKQNEKASEQNADGESGKSGSNISKNTPKGKVTGTSKKRAKATIKNPTYLRALDVESPDATTQVMQYFIRGGRVSPEVIKEMYKNSKKELDSKIGFIKRDAPTLDGLAHSLWQEHESMFGEEQGTTTQDFKNAIEDVLNSYSSRSRMAEEVASKHIDSYIEREYQELEEKAKAEAKEYEEYVGDAIDLFAELTEEQVDRIIAEDAMGEKEVEQTLARELAKEYVTQAETSQAETLTQKEKQLVKEEAKLSKLQQSLEVVGKENQFDIFGGKPSDSMLFETSVSDAEKVYKAQKKVVDALKTEISEIKDEIQTAKDSEVTANQIAMELPTSKLKQASSFIRDAAAKLREQHQKDLDDPNTIQRQGGLSKKQVAIALEKIADIIDAVGDVEKAIKQFLEGIKDPKERLEYEKEINNFFLEEYGESSLKEEPKPFVEIPKVGMDEQMVERTLLSQRLKASNIVDSIKQSFASYEESMREIDSHGKADLSAAKLIQEVGMDEAVRMAKDGEIKGAFQSAVLGAKWLEADNNRKAATTPEEIAAAEKEYNEILKYVGKTQEQMGGANSYWATFYSRNENLGLTTADKIARWEAKAGKVASEGIREAYEKLDAENKENLAEIKRLREEAEKFQVQEIIDEIKDRTKRNPKVATQKAKELADNFRETFKSKPIELKNANGNPILDAEGKPVVLQMQGLNFNQLIEIGAKAIEKTGEIIDGIKAISEKLAEQDWYKSLSKKDKDAVLGQITKTFEDNVKLPEIDTNEPLTTNLLKEMVMKGFDTPEKLLEKVKDFYPNKTDREVRDIITKYGQPIKETQTEIGQKVSAIKSIWAKISQLEDAQSGKLPFRRSAPENKEFRDERRRKTNELREAMKNLDVPEAEMEDKWQTRIEASKNKYKNAIADYEKAIKDGEVIVKNKAEKLNDKDIEELKRELELIKDVYKEVFGEKPMSEGERKIKSLQTQLDSLYKEKEEVEKAEPKYTASEIIDIEALQNEIAARKKALRLEGTEIQTAENIRVEKLQKQLDAIGKEKPTTEKEVIERSQREIDIIKQIESSKAKLAESKKIAEIDAKIAETEKKIEEQNFESAKKESKEKSDAVQKKIDELNEVRNKLKEEKKAFEKSLKTDEQREIERLERQLASLKSKEPTEQAKKDKKQRSEKEIELLEGIASEKERLGLKKTELEAKIIAKERQVQKLRDKIEGAEPETKEKKQIVSDEINKLDAEANELRKLLREQKADMPKEKLQLDAIDRAIDRVESLIKNNDLEIKRKPKEQKTLAVLAKKEVYDNVKKELLKAREEAGIVEREQLRKRAEYLKKRIEYYEERKKKGDYSKKERKKSPINDEINRLLGKNDVLKFEEQKLMHLAEEQAKDWHQKRMDNIADIWNIPRIQMATGEFSFMGVQGRRLGASYFLKNPKALKEAVQTMLKSFASDEKLAEAMSKIKNDDPLLYHAMKVAKLDITEASYKLKAAEENTQRIGGAFLWKLVMDLSFIPLSKGVSKVSGNKTFEGLMKTLKDKPFYENFERAAVGYNNFLRVKAFADFTELMRIEGKNIENSEKEFKIFANYLNTATGRGKLGVLEPIAEPLAKIFFSPRNFSSEFQLATTPFGVGKLAAMQLKSDTKLKNFTQEQSAVKEALKHQIRYTVLQLGVAATATWLLYQNLGSTDENEDGTGVELDTRSTKFGTATFKDGKTVDFFSGGLRYLILASRIATQEYKTSDRVKIFNDKAYVKKGEVKELGEGYIPDALGLITQIAANKVNPSLGAAYTLWTAEPKTNLDKELGIKRDRFGRRVSPLSVAKELTAPIFWKGVVESVQNDPTIVDGLGQLAAFFAFAGYRVQNKEKLAREEQEQVKKDLEVYNKKRAMGLIK